MEWYLKVVRDNYANFKGRARRKEYWMFTLINMLIMFGLMIILGGIGSAIDTPYLLFAAYLYLFAVLVPSLAVTVRRLHDIGKSGWMYLIAFVPFVGSILLIIWFCTDSQPGPNQWGDNPKGIGNDGKINQIGQE